MAPKQTDPQFKLRMTPEIKDAIEAAAKANNRSMNAEILSRLEDSFKKSEEGIVKMAKRPTIKSETLTLRMDLKTKFILELIARLRGQTITTVFERSIQDIADAATFVDPDSKKNCSWKNFWNVEEGIRVLSIARCKTLRPNYEEEKMVNFTEKFWPFLYKNPSFEHYQEKYISVLWKQIDKFIEEDEKHQDFWAAGREMAKALEAANVVAPNWEDMLQKGNKFNK